MRAAFVVRFEPHRGAAFTDCAFGMHGDWLMDHGAHMDAPQWLPQGGASVSSAGVVAEKEALVDCGHVLRERGISIDRRHGHGRRSEDR